jgi:hypothetical protein
MVKSIHMKYPKLVIIVLCTVLSSYALSDSVDDGQVTASEESMTNQEKNDYEGLLKDAISRVEESQSTARKIRDIFAGTGIFNFDSNDSISMKLDESKLKTIEQCQEAQKNLENIRIDIQKLRKAYETESRLGENLKFSEECSHAENELERLKRLESISSDQESISDPVSNSDELKNTSEFYKKCDKLRYALSDIEKYITDAGDMINEAERGVRDAIGRIESEKMLKIARESNKAFGEEVRKLLPLDEEEYIVPVFSCNRAPRKDSEISSVISKITKAGNGFYAGLLLSSSTYCFSSNHKVYVIPLTAEDSSGQAAAIYEEIGQGEVEDYLAGSGGRILYVSSSGGIGQTANKPITIGISGRNGLPRVFMAKERR